MSIGFQPVIEICDFCDEPSRTGAICEACQHEREVDVAEGRRPAGEWDV